MSDGKTRHAKAHKAEVLKRALSPKVAIPIEAIDEDAAALRAIMETYDLVPRSAVHGIAMAIVEAEREARSKGGHAGAAETKAVAAWRQNAVAAVFNALPDDWRDTPFCRETLRAVVDGVRAKRPHDRFQPSTIRSDIEILKKAGKLDIPAKNPKR